MANEFVVITHNSSIHRLKRSTIPLVCGVQWYYFDKQYQLEGAFWITTIRRKKIAMHNTRQVAGHDTGQVAGQVHELLKVVKGEMARKELMAALCLTGRDNFEKLYLKPALEAGLRGMTLPDKPKSRLQKYRVTENGRLYLQEK